MIKIPIIQINIMNTQINNKNYLLNFKYNINYYLFN